jgi:hypothetical protein
MHRRGQVARRGSGFRSRLEHALREFPTGEAPIDCDLHVVRLDHRQSQSRGSDCDDYNRTVGPGSQVCESAKSVRVCAPSDTGKDGGDWTSHSCPKACVAQPNGTGVCR